MRSQVFSWSSSFSHKGMVGIFFALFLLLNVVAATTSAYDGTIAGGPRIIRRGFKSSLLSTARGFGKRSEFSKPMRSAESFEDFEQEANNAKLLSLILKSLENENNKEGSPAVGQFYPPKFLYDYSNRFN